MSMKKIRENEEGRQTDFWRKGGELVVGEEKGFDLESIGGIEGKDQEGQRSGRKAQVLGKETMVSRETCPPTS